MRNSYLGLLDFGGAVRIPMQPGLPRAGIQGLEACLHSFVVSFCEPWEEIRNSVTVSNTLCMCSHSRHPAPAQAAYI